MTHETLGEAMATQVHDARTIHDTTCEAERIPQDRRTAGCECQSRQTAATISRWVRADMKRDRADHIARTERSAAA